MSRSARPTRTTDFWRCSTLFETDVRDGVLGVARPGTRWLSSGWRGGFRDADAAYNVTVPEGFDRTDLDAYARERRHDAGFGDGPTLLTGVEMRHARGTHLDSVTCVATAGVSNPAALPMDPDGSPSDNQPPSDTDRSPGTVNVVVGTTRALDDDALVSLLATVVEAKTATLLARTGFPGTTTDAVIVGSDPDGDHSLFVGSGTEVGAAARACVREAVTASLDARYADVDPPESVADATYGTTTSTRAVVFRPDA